MSNEIARVSPLDKIASASSASSQTAPSIAGSIIPKSPEVANVVVSVPDPVPAEFLISVVPAALTFWPIVAVPLDASTMVTVNQESVVHVPV